MKGAPDAVLPNDRASKRTNVFKSLQQHETFGKTPRLPDQKGFAPTILRGTRKFSLTLWASLEVAWCMQRFAWWPNCYNEQKLLFHPFMYDVVSVQCQYYTDNHNHHTSCINVLACFQLVKALTSHCVDLSVSNVKKAFLGRICIFLGMNWKHLGAERFELSNIKDQRTAPLPRTQYHSGCLTIILKRCLCIATLDWFDTHLTWYMWLD